MVRVVYNPSSTDNVKYDANGNYVANTNTAPNYSTNEYSTTNKYRSEMKLRINLRCLLGKYKFDLKDRFCIKLMDVKAIFEDTNNIITYTSLARYRTSNIWFSGPKLLNGAGKQCLGQVGNFDPNTTEPTYNMVFHRGDQILNRPGILSAFESENIGGTDIQDFVNTQLMPFEISATNPTWENTMISFMRWKWNLNKSFATTTYSSTNPPMENRVLRFRDVVLDTSAVSVASIVATYDDYGTQCCFVQLMVEQQVQQVHLIRQYN